ncbi:hypothetical protein GCM10023238_00980 [Streptomyces heliomycini]
MVGRRVSEAGVLRPTTRTPVLVCHPEDHHWFQRDEGAARPHARVGAHHPVPRGRPAPARRGPRAGAARRDADTLPPPRPPGRARHRQLVSDNRGPRRRVIGAADIWVMVTTAARYADAVPWHMLRTAKEYDVTW